MDDPIFDPWCLENESWPTPSQRTSRWRSASGSTSQGVPASRPVPSRIAATSEDADVVGRPSLDRLEPAELSSPHDRPVQAGLDGAVGLLSALLVPPIDILTQRLIMARHRTTVDNRLGQHAAVLRFRIEPWQGPFDESDGGGGAVLEVALEGTRAVRVAGRLWLDPLSKSPTEQTSVAEEELTSGWIERLLLDFVEKALREG